MGFPGSWALFLGCLCLWGSTLKLRTRASYVGICCGSQNTGSLALAFRGQVSYPRANLRLFGGGDGANCTHRTLERLGVSPTSFHLGETPCCHRSPLTPLKFIICRLQWLRAFRGSASLQALPCFPQTSDELSVTLRNARDTPHGKGYGFH